MSTGTPRESAEGEPPACEVHKYGRRCGEMTATVDPSDWCRSCLVAEARRARAIEQAAEKYLLSLRGWERWSPGHFLYDRTRGGFGTGRVFSLVDALDWLGQQAIARRRKA